MLLQKVLKFSSKILTEYEIQQFNNITYELFDTIYNYLFVLKVALDRSLHIADT